MGDEKRGATRLALELLARGTAHDLNNATSALVANVELIEDGEQVDEEARECLADIREAAERVHQISKLLMRGAGRIVPRRARVDLRRLLDARAVLLRRAHPSLEVVVTCAVDAVTADEQQLDEVLGWLIDNGVHAISLATSTEKPVGRILIEAKQMETERVTCISVVDSGEGMDDAVLRQAKHPFFHGFAGTAGLGLWLAEGTALAHAGRLELSPAGPAGVRATLVLPCDDVAGE